MRVDLYRYVKERLPFKYVSNAGGIEELRKKYLRFDSSSASKKIKALPLLIKDACRLLGLDHRFVKTRIESYCFGRIPYAAEYERNSNLGCTVTVYFDTEKCFDQYFAIVMHELGHYFIQTYGIDFGDDEEICNDIMLVYMGFAEVLKNGYAEHTLSCDSPYFKSEKRALGYIDRYTIEEALDYYNSNAVS